VPDVDRAQRGEAGVPHRQRRERREQRRQEMRGDRLGADDRAQEQERTQP